MFEHFIEHFPAADACWACDPNVGSIFPTEDLETNFLAGFAKEFCIAHVVLDERGDLLLACLGVDRLGTTLHGVGCAVELSRSAAAPELLDSDAFAVTSCTCDGVRDDDVATADTCETTIFGE